MGIERFKSSENYNIKKIELLESIESIREIQIFRMDKPAKRLKIYGRVYLPYIFFVRILYFWDI